MPVRLLCDADERPQAVDLCSLIAAEDMRRDYATYLSKHDALYGPPAADVSDRIAVLQDYLTRTVWTDGDMRACASSWLLLEISQLENQLNRRRYAI